MSMSMSLAQVQSTASLLTMKKSMDAAETQMMALVDMMQQASSPSFGHSLDVRA